jgi:pre-mRNA-splicing factor 18
MDLLRAEMERKRRAMSSTASSSADAVVATDNNVRRGYLTASERRRRLEMEEDERAGTMGMVDGSRTEEGRDAKRKKKNKRRRRDDGDDDDDDDDGVEEEDLTTMITRKYEASSTRSGGGKGTTSTEGGAIVAGGGDGPASSSSSSSSSTNTAKIRASTGGGDDDGCVGTSAVVVPDELANLLPGEASVELRKFGLPVRLFGENDDDRLRRLSMAIRGREAADLGESERDEFLLDSANRTRNVFLMRDGGGGLDDGGTGNARDGMDDDDGDRRKRKISSKGGGDGRGGGTAHAALSSAAVSSSASGMTEEERNDKPKRIYRYFKSLLKMWEEDLSRRSDVIKRSASGKNETKTLKQCRDYIRPLFQLCKRRELEDGLQNHLFDIVLHCESGEFVRAHDAYMDVAIGRAAWPIGVTMVGIHARSGRAKIESSNVAHMMNSEVNRKYLTSVKRLMSYAQKKRPDVHPSKKVMNV